MEGVQMPNPDIAREADYVSATYGEIAHEAEMDDLTYQMWESNISCQECGSKSRHGVPMDWVACGSCGNEDL